MFKVQSSLCKKAVDQPPLQWAASCIFFFFFLVFPVYSFSLISWLADTCAGARGHVIYEPVLLWTLSSHSHRRNSLNQGCVWRLTFLEPAKAAWSKAPTWHKSSFQNNFVTSICFHFDEAIAKCHQSGGLFEMHQRAELEGRRLYAVPQRPHN